MKIKERAIAKLSRNSFTARFLDYDFRTVAFAIVSLVITSGYALFYAVFGAILPSLWYVVLCAYYIMIAIMRALVVLYRERKSQRKESKKDTNEKIIQAKIYGICGLCMSILTLPLSFVILQIVAEKATFSRAGLLIYTEAAYTTYKTVMTVRHAKISRKSCDMRVRAVRCINLADAAVSVFALQVSMFNSFSPNSNWRVFNAVTGAVVCVATIIIGAFMIFDARQTIKRINYDENLKKEFNNECNRN